MANEKIASKAVGFYVNMAANPGTMSYETNPDWQLLACTTSKGFTSDVATISVASDCDSGAAAMEAGDLSWSFRNSYYVVTDPESGAVSDLTLSAVHKSKEKRQFKLESIDDNGASFYRMGYGLITNVQTSVDTGNYMTGEMSVIGIGDYEDNNSGS